MLVPFVSRKKLVSILCYYCCVFADILFISIRGMNCTPKGLCDMVRHTQHPCNAGNFLIFQAKKHVCPDHHKWSMLITHSDIDHTDRYNEYAIARLDLTYTPLQIYIFQMMDLRPCCSPAAIL